MRVKCLAQEHNTMSPDRAQTRTTRSGVERTNHDATAPPKLKFSGNVSCLVPELLVTSETIHNDNDL